MAGRTMSKQRPWYYYVLSMVQSALMFIVRQALIWQSVLFVVGSLATYFGVKQRAKQPKQKNLWPWKKARTDKIESTIDRYSTYLPLLQHSGLDVRSALYRVNTAIVDLRIVLRSLDDALSSIQRRLSAVQWRMLSDGEREEMLEMYEQRYPVENVRRKIKTRVSSPDLRSASREADQKWYKRRDTNAVRT